MKNLAQNIFKRVFTFFWKKLKTEGIFQKLEIFLRKSAIKIRKLSQMFSRFPKFIRQKINEPPICKVNKVVLVKIQAEHPDVICVCISMLRSTSSLNPLIF